MPYGPELTAIYVLAMVAGLAFLLWASHWYVERRLQAWARDRGLLLVRWRSAWPWQGPRAGRRWRNQQDYYVAVLEGERGRMGWLMVNWPIVGFGRPTIRAQWDGCMPEYDGD